MPADLATATTAPPSLSADRASSSIPVAPGADLPKHQQQQQDAPSSTNTWQYPSERQFYEAMRRKGWNPDASDMPAVVAIHNAVNERAWAEVVAWERRAGTAASCGGPRLLRFAGRPGDLSPKARLLNLLGYARPFDRHDWVVDRCGESVRYVIDFYNGAAPGAPVAVHLDVRPALDSPGALFARLGRQWEWVASGRWRSV
jgi:cytochrome c heme-lyase